MGSSKERIILAIVIFIFGLLNYCVAVELASDPAAQSFIVMQTAIKNNDYSQAWQLLSKRIQEKVYRNNLEDFTTAFSKPGMRENFINLQIKEVKPLTDVYVALLVTGLDKAVYMLKASDGWKFDGGIPPRIEKARKDLKLLNGAIEKYRFDKKDLPLSLSELVPDYIAELPLDPFGKGASYIYKIKGDTWIIYSLGPNIKDDLGIEYTPKGGIISDGDILAESEADTR